MQQAFRQMLAINNNYENIEITANLLLGDDLPPIHIPSIVIHIDRTVKGQYRKRVPLYFAIKRQPKHKRTPESIQSNKTKNPHADISLSHPEVIIKKLYYA